MNRRVFSLALCSLALVAGPVAAQTVLTQPVNIAVTVAPGDDYTSASPFASTSVFLACPAGATASISGPFEDGGLIVDNYIQVVGPDATLTNYCPDIESTGCFGGTSNDPMAHLGEPAEASYFPVPPVDVSASLVEGLGLYTFNLMDWSYTFASSQLTLNTTCAVKDQVCHYDSGKRAQKTLTVGAAAIGAHLKHGDTLGACVP